MHDPMTQAFSFSHPWRKSAHGFSSTWLTIWHVDPELDGTDDSCGWFLRARHCDQKLLERVERDFEMDFDRVFKSDSGREYYCGLFKPDGDPHFSTHAIALNLFFTAALRVFGKRKKALSYLNRNLVDILLFAENPIDSLHDEITRKFAKGCSEPYTAHIRAARIRNLACCITTYILRDIRPWYKHPRWHFWHWRIQIHPLQRWVRYFTTRCTACGKRISPRECPVWDGNSKYWCSKCYPVSVSKP